METHIRPIAHTPDEISMGHASWHYPVPSCDAISATANCNGFTPLTAIERRYGWDRESLSRAVTACNNKGEVCILDLSPKLFLVPATKGYGNAPFLINDLIAAIRAAQVRNLHFTHFGFIQGHLPRAEVSAVLNGLFSDANVRQLNRLVIDIDARARVQSDFYALLSSAGATV